MKIILSLVLIAFNSQLLANDLGKETYEITCKTCHAPKVAPGIHAPAAFDKKAWGIRFDMAAAESKKHPKQFKTAIDYLLYRAHIGKGLMPHGGLCHEVKVANKNCSDKALMNAIYYMAGMPETD